MERGQECDKEEEVVAADDGLERCVHVQHAPQKACMHGCRETGLCMMSWQIEHDRFFSTWSVEADPPPVEAAAVEAATSDAAVEAATSDAAVEAATSEEAAATGAAVHALLLLPLLREAVEAAAATAAAVLAARFAAGTANTKGVPPASGAVPKASSSRWTRGLLLPFPSLTPFLKVPLVERSSMTVPFTASCVMRA